MTALIRDTYLEVNLDNIGHNVRTLKAIVGTGVSICAVVKANAYGAGAAEVAQTMFENGVYYLAVATLSEALELREHSDVTRVLVLGYTPDEYLHIAVQNNIALTIMSMEQGILLQELGKKYHKIPVLHIKFNSGMNRLGFDPGEESIKKIETLCRMKGILVEGFFSHLALIGPEEDKAQFERFYAAAQELERRDIAFRFIHICDGITTIDNPQYHLNMVRPGACLYGIKTYKNVNIDIRHVMTMKSRVYQIRKIKKGDTVSYMKMWVAERDSIVATLPFGYSDGLPKAMGNTCSVTIRGQKAPIIGFVCMDQSIVDITDIPDVKVGDDVIIFADGENNTTTLRDIAIAAGTGQNDIASKISRRVPRVYIQDGKKKKTVNYLLRREYA